jgi:hypothetical protein
MENHSNTLTEKLQKQVETLENELFAQRLLVDELEGQIRRVSEDLQRAMSPWPAPQWTTPVPVQPLPAPPHGGVTITTTGISDNTVIWYVDQNGNWKQGI